MNKKSILLTGATGYIGFNLSKELLKRNYQLFYIVRKTSDYNILTQLEDSPNLCFYDGSLSSLRNIIKLAQPNTVIHLASKYIVEHSSNDIDELLTANILFGTQLIEALNEFNCNKFINTGTFWQHYENNAYNPICLYAAMKQAFEDILEYYVKNKKIKVVTLKLFDVYGPNDKRNKIFNLMQEYSKENKPLKMSPGNQRLRMTYIDDVISGYLLALDLIENVSEHQKYFLTTRDYSLKEIISTFEKISGKKLDVRWGAIPYRRRQIMEPLSGNILPGWTAKFSLEEGFKRCMHGN